LSIWATPTVPSPTATCDSNGLSICYRRVASRSTLS
jgi:hypothetical protein